MPIRWHADDRDLLRQAIELTGRGCSLTGVRLLGEVVERVTA